MGTITWDTRPGQANLLWHMKEWGPACCSACQATPWEAPQHAAPISLLLAVHLFITEQGQVLDPVCICSAKIRGRSLMVKAAKITANTGSTAHAFQMSNATLKRTIVPGRSCCSSSRLVQLLLHLGRPAGRLQQLLTRAPSQYILGWLLTGLPWYRSQGQQFNKFVINLKSLLVWSDVDHALANRMRSKLPTAQLKMGLMSATESIPPLMQQVNMWAIASSMPVMQQIQWAASLEQVSWLCNQ